MVQTVLKRVNIHLITHTELYFKIIIVTIINLLLVITRGYGVRATTIEGENAFAQALYFM